MPKTRASSPAGSPFFGRDYAGFLPFHSGSGYALQAQNWVYYTPRQVIHRITVDGIIVSNGGNARAGNVYGALYDANLANWQPVNRLAITADTVLAGVTQRQYIPFTAPVTIASGLYYTGVIKSVTNDNMNPGSGSLNAMAPLAYVGPKFWRQNMGAYLPPPNPAVPVAPGATTADTIWTWLHVP